MHLFRAIATRVVVAYSCTLLTMHTTAASSNPRSKENRVDGQPDLCVYWVAATAKLASPPLPETVVKRSVRFVPGLVPLGPRRMRINQFSLLQLHCVVVVSSYLRIVASQCPVNKLAFRRSTALLAFSKATNTYGEYIVCCKFGALILQTDWRVSPPEGGAFWWWEQACASYHGEVLSCGGG